MTPKFHTLAIQDIIKETDDTVSISFQIPDELKADYAYLSGQYLTLKTIIDNEEIRRSYSLCSASHEGEWRVAIKKVPDGKFSTYANESLKKGMILDVMTPTGNFTLSPDENATKSYALFAAGSGITPIISIAKTVLEMEPNSNVTLVFGNKGFNSIIFREQIEALKNENMSRLRVIHVLSRESLGTPILKGRLDKEKVGYLYDSFFKGIPVDEVFICGPEQMILETKEALLEKGVDSSKIHIELFTTPSTKAPQKKQENLPKVESNVEIILDGDHILLHLDSDGKALLDAAHEAGADLPYACKGGVCCTCKAKILEGSASMDVNYALEPDEVEAGYILTCQAHPTSDKLVVSFDH